MHLRKTLRTFVALTLLLAMSPPAVAAINRAVEVDVTRHPTAIEVRWTPRSALPGSYRLYPEYQLEVSTNLVDWQPMGAPVPQKLGGLATPITQAITNTTAERLYVRVVDRLVLGKNGFFQFLGSEPEVDLRGADLRGANLDDVLLAGGFLLDGADLSNATLQRAAVGYASLRGANLTGAVVIAANFYGTDLTGANFTRVDAREAIFGAAVLTDLNLAQANLLDARSFDDTAPGIRFLNTVLPDGSVRTD